MNKPIIAVDIDDVLAAEAEFVVKFSNEQFGTRLMLEDYSESWNIMWNVDRDEVERRAHILHEPGIVTQYRIIPGGYETLKKLKETYEIIVVTSRRKRVEAETARWLDEHFPDIFSRLVLTGFWDDPRRPDRHLLSKGSLLNDHRVAYVIDDQPKHCLSALDHGIEPILFGDYAESRNVVAPKGVIRCKDWQAVAEFFHA